MIKLFKDDGWNSVASMGSPRQYKHREKPAVKIPVSQVLYPHHTKKDDGFVQDGTFQCLRHTQPNHHLPGSYSSWSALQSPGVLSQEPIIIPLTCRNKRRHLPTMAYSMAINAISVKPTALIRRISTIVSQNVT